MTFGRFAARGALVILVAISLARLTSGVRGYVAFTAVALVGAAVTALVARRVPPIAAWDIGALVVVLAMVVAAEPSRSWLGLPTPDGVRATLLALSHSAGSHFPTRPTPGVVAAGGLLAGVAAAATVVLRGAWAALPALLAAVASCIALPSVGGAALGLGVVAAGAAVAFEPRATRAGWLMVAGSLVAGACCLFALSPSAAVTLGGAPAGTSASLPAVSLPATLFTLESDVTGIERRDANAVMFTARTPVSTYWQVTSLSVVTSNGEWVAPVANGIVPGSGATGGAGTAGSHTFTARVTIARLATALLPVPPGTLGASGGVVTAQGVAVPQATTPGFRYVAVAPVPQSVPNDVTASADPDDLVLPSLPAAVTNLADAVTAGATTPLQKAMALEDWFRSSIFHYSLTAHPSLVDFLTTDHRGSCQQFAGAFATLARAVGLPTRVAIGFTNGAPTRSGGTVVHGADAHAWPQVLFDGTWVSFEPTPPQPSSTLVPAGVLGPAAQGNPNPAGPPPTSATHPHPVTVPTTRPSPPHPGPAKAKTHRTAAPSSSALAWVAGALAVLAVLLLVALALVVRRRRHPARRAPAARVLRAWRRVERALERRGLGRPAWRTPRAHVQVLRTTDVLPSCDDVAAVADLLERGVYAGTPLTAREADVAEAAARRAVRGVRTGRSTSPV